VARELPEVDAVYTISGDPDALVHLRVRDVADLARVIDLIRRGGKVTGTKTLVVLGSEDRAAREGG
jgi:DNA-binding Lrp family transcriptional regulator